jgi:hypothetical protein
VGEVEDYDRVRLESVEPETIVGSAAADLAHLLAELLENSLTFSPPDCAVVVRGRWYDREGYRLTIIDQGMGMSGPAIERANRRLAGTEPFTVAPSKYLGHYVPAGWPPGTASASSSTPSRPWAWPPPSTCPSTSARRPPARRAVSCRRPAPRSPPPPPASCRRPARPPPASGDGGDPSCCRLLVGMGDGAGRAGAGAPGGRR